MLLLKWHLILLAVFACTAQATPNEALWQLHSVPTMTNKVLRDLLPLLHAIRTVSENFSCCEKHHSKDLNAIIVEMMRVELLPYTTKVITEDDVKCAMKRLANPTYLTLIKLNSAKWSKLVLHYRNLFSKLNVTTRPMCLPGPVNTNSLSARLNLLCSIAKRITGEGSHEVLSRCYKIFAEGINVEFILSEQMERFYEKFNISVAIIALKILLTSKELIDSLDRQPPISIIKAALLHKIAITDTSRLHSLLTNMPAHSLEFLLNSAEYYIRNTVIDGANLLLDIPYRNPPGLPEPYKLTDIFRGVMERKQQPTITDFNDLVRDKPHILCKIPPQKMHRLCLIYEEIIKFIYEYYEQSPN